jgi:hypothetical protein
VVPVHVESFQVLQQQQQQQQHRMVWCRFMVAAVAVWRTQHFRSWWMRSNVVSVAALLVMKA